MRHDDLYLRDIVVAIDDIEGFLDGVSREVFVVDRLLRSAVMHQLTIIGEAAASLPRAFRDRHPAVPWAAIVRFRNVVVHHYFGIDWDAVWDVIDKDLQPLRAAVAAILAVEFPESAAPAPQP